MGLCLQNWVLLQEKQSKLQQGKRGYGWLIQTINQIGNYQNVNVQTKKAGNISAAERERERERERKEGNGGDGRERGVVLEEENYLRLVRIEKKYPKTVEKMILKIPI